MRIETPTRNEINSFDDWAKIHDTPKEKVHWKRGRSAYSAAEFMMNQNGEESIRTRVSDEVGAGGLGKKILSNGSKKTRKATNHPEEQKIF